VATADGQRAVCGCTIKRLQETLPYGEFAAADKAIRQGKPVAPKTRKTIDDATGSCRQ
jgi:hypothetical protein